MLRKYKSQLRESIESADLCRVCLGNGATYPIFECKEHKESIYLKLSLFIDKKIEDIEGYPRKICETCKNALDTVCDFISKYKESSEILEKTLHVIVKEEEETAEVDVSNDDPETDIDIFKDIKVEVVQDHEDSTLNINSIQENGKNVKKQYKPYRKRCVNLNNNITNKLASSVLEGCFTWDGVKWCLKSKDINKKIPVKITSEKISKTTDRQKEPLCKIPKERKPHIPKLCDLCGVTFKNKDSLSTHQKITHFKQPQQCSQCQKTCSSLFNLNRHMKRQHSTTDKTYICSECGVMFAFPGELKNHVRRVHEKHLHPQREWTCKICDKTYKCRKSLIIHERSIHTGDRPAVCSVCDSSFYHEDYLKEHMRLHTGETPFKCPICGRGYAQRGNMKSHLRNHRISELDSATISKLRPAYLKRLKK